MFECLLRRNVLICLLWIFRTTSLKTYIRITLLNPLMLDDTWWWCFMMLHDALWCLMTIDNAVMIAVLNKCLWQTLLTLESHCNLKEGKFILYHQRVKAFIHIETSECQQHPDNELLPSDFANFLLCLIRLHWLELQSTRFSLQQDVSYVFSMNPWSNWTPSFGICSSWGFWNTP